MATIMQPVTVTADSANSGTAEASVSVTDALDFPASGDFPVTVQFNQTGPTTFDYLVNGTAGGTYDSSSPAPIQIDGYQLDMNGNQCLSCHARARVTESGAPMISITHFMDRDGQFLAAVSPRRYFCNQCHVVQTEAPVPIENTFVDIDSLLAGENAKTGN